MNTETINNIWKKTKNLITTFKKYDLEQRIKKTALKVFEENIKGYVFADKYGKKEGLNTYFLPISNNDNILPKIRILVENFKKYDLEKRISNVAIQKLNTQIQELVAREEEAARARERERERLEQAAREQDAINKIQIEAKNAVTNELNVYSTKNLASMFTDNIIDSVSKNLEQNTLLINAIKKTAIDAVANELVSIQIKENDKDIIDQTDVKKQIIGKLIKKYLPLIRTILAIKKAAIDAVNKSTDIDSIEKELFGMIDEFEKLNEAMNNVETETEKKDAETKLNEIQEKLKKLLEDYKNLANNIPDKDKQIAALRKEIEFLNRIQNTNIREQKPYLDRLQSEIAALKQSILQKELENIAINKVLSKIPRQPEVAAPNLDAINNLRKENEDLIEIIKRLNEDNVKRDLGEIAKKTVANAVTAIAPTGSVATGSTVPLPKPVINIENDLKNAALTAFYNALLGVPREPIDISKKPLKFDVLITDKTYKYDEKGLPVEEKELTKYDSILAK